MRFKFIELYAECVSQRLLFQNPQKTFNTYYNNYENNKKM